ncbi:carboxypeptidase D-like [Saccoglossus kowalevskii]
MNETYDSHTYLYSIGQSVQQNELYVIAIAGNNPEKHVIGRPEVKYVGNMHGNEVVGRELLIQFIEHLLYNYETDDDIKKFLDNTRVHIMVTMNPDGFEISGEDCSGNVGRMNANGFNLNRNFPDYFEENEDPIQPETRAVMDWLEEIPFILSANLHGGALVVNYPFDNTEPENKAEEPYPYAECPDDDVYRNISLIYSKTHAIMHDIEYNSCNGTDSGFEDGITNGVEWYPAKGTMQDYNYIFTGCLEVTLEVACCKYPSEDRLELHWDWNRDSMMEYLKQVHKGVKGRVSDENGNPVSGAIMSIKGRDLDFTTSADGEYWRILLPGLYELSVRKDGYISGSSATATVEVSGILYDVTEQDFQILSHAQY